MKELLIYFGKLWLEFWGRNRIAPRYPFRESEIATSGFRIKVSPVWEAYYLHLHPTHYAVATGPDGRIMSLRGGYNRLPPGHYLLHYVDKGNRVTRIPRTTETTFDGFQVLLELVVTYRVIDPIKALEVQQPVETLIIFIQSDLKEFIRSHKYNEIVGDQDGSRIDNELLTRYIREQHATRHQMSKLFLIADVVVEEKVGDPRVNDIRDKFQLNQREFNAKSEMERQNQELKKTVAEQEAAIQQVQAQAEVRQQEILRTMKIQQIQLENARQQFQARQDTYAQAIAAISQVLSNQMNPPDSHALEIIHKLVEEMSDSMEQTVETNDGQGDRPSQASNGPANTKRIGELTKTLLSWLDTKRP